MRAVAVLLAIVALLTAPVAHAELTSTTTINGEVPPGVPTKLVDLTVVTDTVQVDGDRLLVMQGLRKPGTRAPIHYHSYGGRTCVLKGTMTDFVEGMEPMIFPAGTCYDMAANTPMTAANLGEEDVLLVDTFVLPPRDASIIVVEPNWPDLTDPTG